MEMVGSVTRLKLGRVDLIEFGLRMSVMGGCP